MQAPSVPPRTMTAADTCMTSEGLPFSINKPAAIAPNATTIPRMLARSGRVERSLGPFPLSAISIFLNLVVFVFVPEGNGSQRDVWQDRTAEFDDLADNLLGRFHHPQLLAGDQRDHGIGGLIDVFDQIRVEDQARVTDAGKFDLRPLKSARPLVHAALYGECISMKR